MRSVISFPTCTILRRSLVGHEAREVRYHVPGRCARRACIALIHSLAEKDEHLADLDPADEIYDYEFRAAIEALASEFSAYEGGHDTRPAGEPMHGDGAIKTSVHQEPRQADAA